MHVRGLKYLGGWVVVISSGIIKNLFFNNSLDCKSGGEHQNRTSVHGIEIHKCALVRNSDKFGDKPILWISGNYYIAINTLILMVLMAPAVGIEPTTN